MNEEMFSEVYEERRAAVPRGIPLIVVLRGFSDAGQTVSQLDDMFWSRYEPEEIIKFSNDHLLDYRARRPVITFDEDHLTDYTPEGLTLSLAHDELGTPFLLLSGYEPDFRWEEFVETILLLVHEFEVTVTTWTHAIPMPVPHTRPIGVTVSGSKDELIEARSIWKPTTKLAATVGHVLEYRLHNLAEEVVGFVLLVPHYLANTEYPDALLTGLECVMAATGLLFSTTETRAESENFRARVDEQVSENDESLEMLRNLEMRYDEYMQTRDADNSHLSMGDQPLPTADQLASELERFLAEHRGNENGDRTSD